MYFENGIQIQKLNLESAEQQGELAYHARSAIDAILSGEQTDLSDAVFVYELTPGEGAENGIAASIDGAGKYTQFRKITLPFVVFSITPVLIGQFVGNFNNFGIYFFLRSGLQSNYADYFLASDTDLLINWLYNLSVSNNYYSIGAAISLVIFIITGTLSLIVYVRSAAYKREETFQ